MAAVKLILIVLIIGLIAFLVFALFKVNRLNISIRIKSKVLKESIDKINKKLGEIEDTK